MIEINADTRRAVVTNKELLTTGSAGIEVQFTLSEDWNGLVKLAVFRVGDDWKSEDVVLDSSRKCVVPAEALVTEHAEEVLFIGIYGSNGNGTIIIPTIWASAGAIRPGTTPNNPSEPAPTPSLIEQLLRIAQDAEITADDAYTMAENAQGYIVEKNVTDAVEHFVNDTVPDAIGQVEAEGDTQIERINQAVEDVQEAIDQANEDAAEIISDLRGGIDTLEDEEETIVQRINSALDQGTDDTLSRQGWPADAKAAGNAIGALNNAFTQLDDVYVSLDGENQVTPQNIGGMQFTETSIIDYGDDFFSEDFLFEENYYVSINTGVTPPVISHGAIANYKTYCIPIDSNSKYSFTSARFAALSKGNTLGSEAVGTLQPYATEIETGEASYLFLSYPNSTTTKEIKKFESQTLYTDFVVPYWFENTRKNVHSKYASVTAASMTNGNYIQIENVKNNLRKGERIVVSADITSFTKVRINFSYSLSGSTNFIEINDTYITVKNSSTVYTAHGLTISDNFTLEYEYLDDNTAQITLTSDGNSYTHIYTFVRQSVGYPVFSCMDASLTNVKMSWTCKDLCKNIWVFGDSYVGYATTRWPYYLKEQGYDKNILLDGFPGEGSVNARVSFNNLLQFSVPKFAVWCMGMNDEGDSSSAPSSNWVSGRDLFLSYCSSNNVTPIFGTIPTVPTINNEQKNAWIRASGYRYIDFAQAVGAQSDGTWYTGMLAQDGVHPTEQGAKALYARVLLDLPEIMIDDFE